MSLNPHATFSRLQRFNCYVKNFVWEVQSKKVFHTLAIQAQVFYQAISLQIGLAVL